MPGFGSRSRRGYRVGKKKAGTAHRPFYTSDSWPLFFLLGFRLPSLVQMAEFRRRCYHPLAALPVLGGRGAADFLHDFLFGRFLLRGDFLLGLTHATSSVKVINTGSLYPRSKILSTKKHHFILIILSDG